MPERGELWWVDLDPVVGRELGRKIWPAVIVSCDELYGSGLEKLVVVPGTTQEHEVPWRVQWAYRTPQGPRHTYFCCDDVRAISTERLRGRIGTSAIPPTVMRRIEETLKLLLELP